MPRYPSLYQINARTLMRELAPGLGRAATLDDMPDALLDQAARDGFDWVWFLGVWQTGAAGRVVSRSRQEWLTEYRTMLPDLTEDDICGSCFALTGYTVHHDLGGDAALQRLRERVHARGLKLMLDFVPNHTALDHPWVQAHPDYYVPGSLDALAREPQNYAHLGEHVFAYGRDPYFDGWPDTLQLNYGQPAAQEAMARELARVAMLCDGVRCDMAMLILPDVFVRTWGIVMQPFWPHAIAQARAAHPGFVFMAEVYWDLEWTLLQQGFDYAYDKRLYDRLRAGQAGPVRAHLSAGLDYQDHMARFLENHDEPRAAAVFAPEVERAAAIATFLAPGLRFFQRGQLQGFKKRVSVHLCRGPNEPADPALQTFYEHLLAVLRDPAVREGEWRLLDCASAWDGNPTSDNFIAFLWQHGDDIDADARFVAVNYGPTQAQCYVRLPFDWLRGATWRLQDLMSDARYDRDGDDLAARGLYLDMPAWGYHVFKMVRV